MTEITTFVAQMNPGMAHGQGGISSEFLSCYLTAEIDIVKPRLSIYPGTSQIYAFKWGCLIGGIFAFAVFMTLL